MGKVEPPTEFSKSKSSVGCQFLEAVAAKKWLTFFEGLNFLHKQLKSEIFNDKKVVYNQKKIFCNLNWEF